MGVSRGFLIWLLGIPRRSSFCSLSGIELSVCIARVCAASRDRLRRLSNHFDRLADPRKKSHCSPNGLPDDFNEPGHCVGLRHPSQRFGGLARARASVPDAPSQRHSEFRRSSRGIDAVALAVQANVHDDQGKGGRLMTLVPRTGSTFHSIARHGKRESPAGPDGAFDFNATEGCWTGDGAFRQLINARCPGAVP
jgi:hypothetical protein